MKKNRIKYSRLFKQVFLLISLSLLLYSCKTEYPALPYNDIVSFGLEDSQEDTLSAAIVGKEILVYWPPMQATPETITPWIKVSEGASISPSSGTTVGFKETTTYTVTAADGTTQTYTLKPVINQPIPYLSDVSIPTVENGDKTGIKWGSYSKISGNYLYNELYPTNVVFVNETDKEIPIQLNYPSRTGMQLDLSDSNIPAGKYKGIKLYVGNRSLDVLQKEFYFIHIPYGATLIDTEKNRYKRGEEFTMKGRNYNLVEEAALSNYAEMDGTQQYKLDIVAKTDSTIRVKIPASIPNFPAENDVYVFFSYNGGEMYDNKLTKERASLGWESIIITD